MRAQVSHWCTNAQTFIQATKMIVSYTPSAVRGDVKPCLQHHHGTAMGKRFASILANTHLIKFDKAVVSNFHIKP
jgi:hypothetical protein